MRFLKYAGRVILFLVVFLIGLWVFAPWDELGVLAFEELRTAAASRGYYFTCVGIRREGLFPPRYVFSEMDVEGSMVKATFGEATVGLKPLRSALSGKAAFRMGFTDASVRYIPNNGFSLASGNVMIEANAANVMMRNIAVDGDLKMNGGMKLGLGDRTIVESDVVMTVPPELNMILNMPMMGRFVESVSPGEWRIRANAAQGW
jgi:hypothetical protein